MTEPPEVVRNHKDSLFRLLFREKKELLELYNALNNTAYTDEKELEIFTLENAIYMNMKNDVSFLLDFQLSLYEHQGSFCPKCRCGIWDTSPDSWNATRRINPCIQADW